MLCSGAKRCEILLKGLSVHGLTCSALATTPAEILININIIAFIIIFLIHFPFSFSLQPLFSSLTQPVFQDNRHTHSIVALVVLAHPFLHSIQHAPISSHFDSTTRPALSLHPR